MEDGLLTVQEGASIASWNYLGYLIGALLAVRWHRVAQIRRSLPWALALHVLSSLLQTQAESADALAALRLANGISNGLVFVQAPSLILEWLARQQRVSASGLVYLGVCVGLILSSLLVSLSDGYLLGADRWYGGAAVDAAGLVGLAPAVAAGPANRAGPAPSATTPSGKLLDRASTPLFLLRRRRNGLHPADDLSAHGGAPAWSPATFSSAAAGWWWRWQPCPRPGCGTVWCAPGRRHRPAPELSDPAARRAGRSAVAGAVGILLCAVLVGGTFLGTVLLTQRLARALQPHQGPRLSAALIALYGLTQLAAPWLTSIWMGMGGSLHSAFWLGAGALLWGYCGC